MLTFLKACSDIDHLKVSFTEEEILDPSKYFLGTIYHTEATRKSFQILFKRVKFIQMNAHWYSANETQATGYKRMRMLIT